MRDVKLAPDANSVVVINEQNARAFGPVIHSRHAWNTYARYDALNDYENCGRALLTGPVWPLRTRDTADEYHEIQ